MKCSRRFIYTIVGAASCCVSSLLCGPSFGQAPATQPSAPGTQSTANPSGANNNSSQSPQSSAGGTQPGGAASGTNSSGTAGSVNGQPDTSHSGPRSSTPATTPDGTVGPTAERNAAVETGNAAAAAGHRGPMSDDAGLAAWLIVDNEGEIAVSEIGRQKAQDPAVKQFAERMVQEHNQMLAKLRPLASNMNSLPGGRRTHSVSARDSGAALTTATGSQPNAAGDAQSSNNTATSSGTNNPAGTAQSGSSTAGTVESGRLAGTQSLSSGTPSAISLKRELGAQCLRSKQEELNSKQGAEFDKCFMGIQVAMHMEAADTLRVFQKHAAGSLRQTLDEALKTTEAHLDHAKQVFKTAEQKLQGDAKK